MLSRCRTRGFRVVRCDHDSQENCRRVHSKVGQYLPRRHSLPYFDLFYQA